MIRFRTTLAATLVFAPLLACHPKPAEGPAEKAGKSVDHAAEKTKDTVEHATETTKKKLD